MILIMKVKKLEFSVKDKIYCHFFLVYVEHSSSSFQFVHKNWSRNARNGLFN